MRPGPGLGRAGPNGTGPAGLQLMGARERTHAHTRKHALTLALVYGHTDAESVTHALMHARARTHTHKRTHARTHARKRTQAHAHA